MKFKYPVGNQYVDVTNRVQLNQYFLSIYRPSTKLGDFEKCFFWGFFVPVATVGCSHCIDAT